MSQLDCFHFNKRFPCYSIIILTFLWLAPHNPFTPRSSRSILIPQSHLEKLITALHPRLIMVILCHYHRIRLAALALTLPLSQHPYRTLTSVIELSILLPRLLSTVPSQIFGWHTLCHTRTLPAHPWPIHLWSVTIFCRILFPTHSTDLPPLALYKSKCKI